MGTNYYLIKRENNKELQNLYKKYNTLNTEELKTELEGIISNSIKNIVDNKYFDKELLKDYIDEKIDSLINSTTSYIEDKLVDNKEYIHIGKSSEGWLFAFQTQPQWHSYKEFKEFIKNNKDKYDIMDEYDRIISVKDLLNLIDTIQKDEQCLSNPDNFKYDKNVDGYRFSDRDFS